LEQSGTGTETGKGSQVSTATTTTTTGYIGWCRLPKQRWHKAVESDTRDAALSALLDYAQRVPGPHKDLIVLEAGRHPEGRR
jgi:hypothetical protein